VLPDAFDFFTFFSMDHVEYFPSTSYRENFYAGVHHRVLVNFTGTGIAPLNETPYWGSAGRLLGLGLLDTGTRGVYDGNCTHELLHQWGAYLNPTLGLTKGEGHYGRMGSVDSLLGGTHWSVSSNAAFLTDCEFERPEASPLDKYLMGLILGSSVPLHYSSTNANCYNFVSTTRQ